MMAHIRQMITGCAAVALAFAFLLGAQYFSTTEERVLNHPNVHNLTAGHFESSYQFSATDPVESNWRAAHFPSEDLKLLPGYAPDTTLYYRFELRRSQHIASALQATDVAFTPYYVNHREYDVMVNDEFRFAQRGSAASSIPVVALRNQDWKKDGVATIKIVARIHPGDTGISHFGSMLTGPADILERLNVANDRMNVSYYLMFMLAKGSILFLFLVLALFTSSYRGQISFLVFAATCFLEEWVRSDIFFATQDPTAKAVLFFVLRMFGGCALFALLQNQVTRTPRWIWALVSVFGAAVPVWVAYDAYQAADGIPQIVLALRLSTAWMLMLCGLHLQDCWRNGGTKSFASVRTLFVSAYAAVLVTELVLKPYQGFELRAAGDLLFFVWAAVDAGLRFAGQERRKTELEHELAQSKLEAAVGTLTQMLAHEVRKPLYMLRNLADIITQQDELDPSLAKDLLKDFRSEYSQTITQVDRLLDDVLISTRRLNLTGELLQVEQLFRTALTGLQYLPSLAEKVVVQPSALTVWGDPHRLVRLLQNLIENAHHAAPQSFIGICAQASIQQGCVDLCVSNDGAELSAELLKKMFDPGFSTKVAGHGLGLSIVRKIAVDHGGNVECHVVKGKTEFRVSLPHSAPKGVER